MVSWIESAPSVWRKASIVGADLTAWPCEWSAYSHAFAVSDAYLALYLCACDAWCMCVYMEQSAIFNFQALLIVILLTICTCAYLRSNMPSIIDRNKTGYVHTRTHHACTTHIISLHHRCVALAAGSIGIRTTLSLAASNHACLRICSLVCFVVRWRKWCLGIFLQSFGTVLEGCTYRRKVIVFVSVFVSIWLSMCLCGMHTHARVCLFWNMRGFWNMPP